MNPSVILSAAEVVAITGYQQAKRQARWFAAHGFKATINARNECIVFRTDLEERKVDRPKVRMLHVA